MPPPKTTLWKLEPHTRGKHLILQNYLDAWLPILGTWSNRILVIDGFAGPGEYAYGEAGSPQIILQAFAQHRAKGQIKAQVDFWFIEEDPKRFAHLKDVIERHRTGLTGKVAIHTVEGCFDSTLHHLLEQVDRQSGSQDPTFLMIDPFGVAGTPMSIISRVLRNPKSEVFISFMYDSINKRKGLPDWEPHLNELFGSEGWKQGNDIEDPEERRRFFFGEYEKQLRTAGAQYVLRFDLYEGARLVYAIFFGTKNLKGADKMKAAIWKIAPFGTFAFYGSRTPQLVVDVKPNTGQLKNQLIEQFAPKGWVTIQEIESFVNSDQTDFHSGHLKKLTLIPMEAENLVEVDRSNGTRKNTYPPGTRLRFPTPN